jgi:lipopolysaccharide/colanic/teichoic acid biosynthesis glycosyltransferase
VFRKNFAVFTRIKKGSGEVLKLLFPRRKTVAATGHAAPAAGRPQPGAANGATGNVILAGPRRRLMCDSTLYPACKAVLDFVAAVCLLVFLGPVILATMVLVKLTSRGPALYTQTRMGLNGKPFTIYKLRTMIHKCETLSGATWSRPGDPRITPLGRFLRKTHLDELPQLFNVIFGQMSLVGPRPERPEFLPQLEQAVPYYRERLLVRPGVTGLAQVQLPPDTDLDSVRLKLAYDLYYVQQAGFWMDVRLVLCTAFKMAGLSFAALRRLFCIPTRETIEGAYRSLGPEPRPAAPKPCLRPA